MIVERKKGKLSLRLVVAITTASMLPTVSMPASWTLPTVYAAEQKRVLTKEEALAAAQKWVAIPQGYKLEGSTYQDEDESFHAGRSVWRLRWEKGEEKTIYLTIDAKTGALLQYSNYDDENNNDKNLEGISRDQAIQIGRDFLRKVGDKKELDKLSKANEFGSSYPEYPMRAGSELITFTRVENGIPFLENGFKFWIGKDGQIINFERQWHEGVLPEAKAVLDKEKAEAKLKEKLAPTLLYIRMQELSGNYRSQENSYKLIYRYEESDPQMLDALTGEVLNRLSEPAKQREIKPLGATIRKDGRKKGNITKDEAQKIAEKLIAKLPGKYRSDGSHGSGASTGPDGITTERWDFEFTPTDSKKKQTEPIELSINEYGKLVGYKATDEPFISRQKKKIEKAISWKQAQENAVKLIKNLLDDRLGEIYLEDQPPSELQKRMDMGSYQIRFRMMHNGIPLADGGFSATVDAENGQVIRVSWYDHDMQTPNLESPAKKIDREAAKQAELKEKKLLLTYYMPDRYFSGKETKPKLVYRFVGDNGVVDGKTGEWISYSKLRETLRPQDIAGHPAKEALEFAINEEFLPVKDGKVEPDKQVTRSELLYMALQMRDRMDRYVDRNNREQAPYQFADVSGADPVYPAVQQAIRLGLVAPQGKLFEPSRPVTRVEAAKMAVQLMGYGPLLTKQDIFNSKNYSDVAPQDLPAVALAQAFSLFGAPTSGSFQPNQPLTRAEAAQLFFALKKLIDQK